jgi:serine/threonine-protein kinase
VILPQEFALDKERLARFEREARVLASLNHPNIATIHGLEKADGKQLLVMELVEGDTLSQRINKGPLSLEESLDLCRQIAEGLQSAHDRGIIHRDLKPGNIKITAEGKVKILDFGLAKPYQEVQEAIDLSKSPTLTDRMTQPGVILGTAAYMSPEQARSRPVDKRTDIWAFGCVLYECLSGKMAFPGETFSDTLAHILKGEPDWSKIPSSTPSSIRTLLKRCLQKDHRRRLRDIGDARIEIDESGPPSFEEGVAIKKSPWGWIFAAGAILFIVGFLIRPLIWDTSEAIPSNKPVASIIKLQPGYGLDGDRSPLEYDWPTLTAVAISRDGGFVVYCAVDDDTADAKPCLFMRRIDELEASLIPGTEGGIAPFLSADDRWVGFWADGKLKKVPVEGGIAQDLCEASMKGACWGVNGRVVFSDDVNQGLSAVDASGGAPEVLTIPDKAQGEGEHLLPFYLPNDRGILFTVIRSGIGAVVDLNPRIALFDIQTRERKFLIDNASDAQYIPTVHIVFLRTGELWAVPFSLQDLETTGPAVPIRSDIVQALIPTARNTTAGQYSISDSGHLIFAPGGVPPPWVNSLAWVDSQGNDVPACTQLDQHYIPRLSPDGTKIAYQTLYSREHIWIWDIQREMSYPLVSEGACGFPVWTPDGKKIIYRKILPDRQSGIFSISADGIDSTEELIFTIPSGSTYYPTSVSPDGKRLALSAYENGQSRDIYIYDFASQSCAPFRITPYDERYPSFSPDGRWIIYTSDQEGRDDVYVSPADGSGGSIMVSIDRGREPVWARNGRRFFYRSYLDSSRAQFTQMWAVDVKPGTEFSPGKPRLLFQTNKFGVSAHAPCWDISLDDKMFLMVRREDRPPKPLTELVLIQNWFEELERLVTVKK